MKRYVVTAVGAQEIVGTQEIVGQTSSSSVPWSNFQALLFVAGAFVIGGVLGALFAKSLGLGTAAGLFAAKHKDAIAGTAMLMSRL
jgi:hypothetical protein